MTIMHQTDERRGGEMLTAKGWHRWVLCGRQVVAERVVDHRILTTCRVCRRVERKQRAATV